MANTVHTQPHTRLELTLVVTRACSKFLSRTLGCVHEVFRWYVIEKWTSELLSNNKSVNRLGLCRFAAYKSACSLNSAAVILSCSTTRREEGGRNWWNRWRAAAAATIADDAAVVSRLVSLTNGLFDANGRRKHFVVAGAWNDVSSCADDV